MARPKTPRAAESPTSSRPTRAKSRTAAVVEPSSGKQQPSSRKKWSRFWLTLLGLSLVSLLGWGMVVRIKRGPEIPLPRDGSALRLGLTADEAKNILGKLDMRSYNNDPDFGIVSLKKPKNLPGNPEALDLVFYKKKLFFLSQQWNVADPTRDMLQMAYKFRRWVRPGGGQLQSLGTDTTLQEWYLRDQATEVILRELKYPGHIQQMMDVRDAADPEAVAAFAKHRIDDWPK
jgi:hypothetical protein